MFHSLVIRGPGCMVTTDMSNNSNPRVVILGAGITGLTLARELSEHFRGKVLVLEKEDFVGGLASTHQRDGFSFDLGSHRLHRDSPERILRYIEQVIGEDLLLSQRRGKVYYRGGFVSYPPRLTSLLRDFSLREILEVSLSYVRSFMNGQNREGSDYESAMRVAVGQKLYETFYKDFAKKLWGMDPRYLSIDSMRKRRTPLFRQSLKRSFSGNGDRFLYPRNGIGAISKKLEQRILDSGGEMIKGVRLKNVSIHDNRISKISFGRGQTDEEMTTEVLILISTIPIDDLFTLVFSGEKYDPNLEWRGLRLLCLVIDHALKDDCETYYFPSTEVTLGRVSEIKKYSLHLNPTLKGTLLTIEIPASWGDDIMTMNEAELLDRCLHDLAGVKIVETYPKVLSYCTMALEKVYPIYRLGWKARFFEAYERLSQIENLFTIGRGGLFLHCNIDHCILQGLDLSDFILRGEWCHKDLWHKKVLEFLEFSARD